MAGLVSSSRALSPGQDAGPWAQSSHRLPGGVHTGHWPWGKQLDSSARHIRFPHRVPPPRGYTSALGVVGEVMGCPEALGEEFLGGQGVDGALGGVGRRRWVPSPAQGCRPQVEKSMGLGLATPRVRFR